MSGKTVLEIVTEYLGANGFDGLWYDDECGCCVEDLAPCGEINGQCRAGHNVNTVDGWIIGPDKKDNSR